MPAVVSHQDESQVCCKLGRAVLQAWLDLQCTPREPSDVSPVAGELLCLVSGVRANPGGPCNLLGTICMCSSTQRV